MILGRWRICWARLRAQFRENHEISKGEIVTRKFCRVRERVGKLTFLRATAP